jgi:hypothetical protein
VLPIGDFGCIAVEIDETARPSRVSTHRHGIAVPICDVENPAVTRQLKIVPDDHQPGLSRPPSLIAVSISETLWDPQLLT